jgi:hypothetical protein
MSDSSTSSSGDGQAAKKPQLSFGQVLEKAAASAAKGGIAGACAMVANVAALMWIRTAVRFSVKICNMQMPAIG